MSALSDLDPSKLTAAQKATLLKLQRCAFFRVAGGWAVPGEGRRISNGLADHLMNHGLARKVIDRGRAVLTTTGSGKTLAAVIEQRRAR
jgi:hypothetical protein